MAPTLDKLIADPCSAVDSESISKTIDHALEIFADAPADVSITAGVYKNLGVLFERRYQQQKDFDDLQKAISWAKQGAATNLPLVSHRF
jgi:hypothetical protein